MRLPIKHPLFKGLWCYESNIGKLFPDARLSVPDLYKVEMQLEDLAALSLYVPEHYKPNIRYRLPDIGLPLSPMVQPGMEELSHALLHTPV